MSRSTDISTYFFQLGDITIQPASPGGLKWSIMSIQSADSGRAENGEMIATLVAKKRKLEIKYANLSPEDAKAILEEVCGNMFFEVTYYDILAGEQETRTFYVGDRSTDWYNYNIERGLENLAFNIIEK